VLEKKAIKKERKCCRFFTTIPSPQGKTEGEETALHQKRSHGGNKGDLTLFALRVEEGPPQKRSSRKQGGGEKGERLKRVDASQRPFVT